MTIEQALGPSFVRRVQERSAGLAIDTVDRSLVELAVAGIFAIRGENLFWIVGENESHGERVEKTCMWLHMLGVADAQIHVHAIPFQDPYINREPELGALEAKARLLSDWRAGKRAIVLTTLAAIGLRQREPLSPRDPGIEIRAGEMFPRGRFIAELTDAGYIRSDFVENRGDVAWRGSVVDLFPLGSDHPLRIEFEGDRILSLRAFDLDTQRSISVLERTFIFSPRGLHTQPDGAEERKGSGFTILDRGKPFTLVASNFHRQREEYAKLLGHFSSLRESVAEPAPALDSLFFPPPSFAEVIDLPDFPRDPSVRMVLLPSGRTLKGLTEEDANELRMQAKAGTSLFFFSEQKPLAEKIKEWIGDGEALAMAIPGSFENRESGALFLATKPYRYLEKVEKPRDAGVEKWIREIGTGDYVVHRLHGIGKFLGFKNLAFEGVSQEFLWLEYQNREFLYVSPHDADVLSRYNSFEGQFPALDRLGGKTWKGKVYRAKRNIVHFARELLDLYALRQSIKGISHPPSPEFEERLRDSFIYVETEDQKRAIRETLDDLEKGFPMDRLVCGDVSFGKTEVAIRAAARVVASQRQVAMLCPTTILAYQHHQTFSRRFQDLPVSVAMLSRMVPPRERREIVAKIGEGKVDIVVGTHSLLSRQVEFKRLGLYIIDEEQRFGVFQKEKLKKRREEVDVLVLTATPIPRTLSLALGGLQDISLIRTPPLGRLAVQNFIGHFSRQSLLSAIWNELEREGQVYLVYNSVARIYSFRDTLQSWLPDVSIGVLHAQLPSPEIERTMLAFIRKEHQVLLSTTIIENGIDIPAVNTLVVVDADRFGLTQLYQLRGRIGRSDRQAFAHFLVDPARADMTEKARKRLDALREFSELGSGYKVAEFDLMLRGAGSLLGSQQHGHIEALGFDYYLELIQQTVNTLRGMEEAAFAPELHVHFSYAVDEKYIEDPAERLHVYRRVLEAKDGSDFFIIREELEDQYGRMPDSLNQLFYVGAAKLFAHRYRWKRIDVHRDHLEVEPLFPLPQMPANAPFRPSANGRLSLPFRDFSLFVQQCQSWPHFFPEHARNLQMG